jgi:hypothetical protein
MFEGIALGEVFAYVLDLRIAFLVEKHESGIKRR